MQYLYLSRTLLTIKCIDFLDLIFHGHVTNVIKKRKIPRVTITRKCFIYNYVYFNIRPFALQEIYFCSKINYKTLIISVDE